MKAKYKDLGLGMNDVARFGLFHTFSVAVVVINIFFFVLFASRAVPSSRYVADLPIQWYEYVATVFGVFLPIALIGLFAPVVARRTLQNPRIKYTFFTWVAVVGGLSVVMSRIISGLMHVSCSVCVPSVPSYESIEIMFWLELIIAFGLPVVLGLPQRRAK